MSQNILDNLLTNYTRDVPSITAVAIVDRDGLIITSKGIESDDTVLGGISASIDSHVDRIKKEFGTEGAFFSLQNIGNKKFAFACQGETSILTTISEISTPDILLRVYSEHVAKTVHLILEGRENISIEIPAIIRLLSKTRQGKLPEGTFSTKLVLCGDYSVGKTSLVKRFVENKFSENYLSTLGVDISKKTIQLGEKTSFSFIIWDIGGQKDAFLSQRNKFYDGANSAFIVVDRTRQGNLGIINQWYKNIKQSVKVDIPIILVANKSDLVNEIKISEDNVKKKADELGFNYILTSAKSGMNVDDSFRYIAYKMIESS